ncbi:MAG: fimbrillin family protein, partial [Bacteroidaceae bacterium]
MLGLGALLLTSCDQDITNEIYLPGGGSVVVTDSTSTKQLQVFTNLEMLQPAYNTRAVDNQWEANDMIGISSTGMMNNMKFTRNGNTSQFVGASTVWFKDLTTHTFNAYYPYNATPNNDLIEFTIPENAVQSAQKVNDFLFAGGTASYANPELTLNFTHQMTRLIIKVYTSPEYGFTTNEFDGSMLTFLGYFESGTFNIKTGEVKAKEVYVDANYYGEAKDDHAEFTLYVPAQQMPDLRLE